VRLYALAAALALLAVSAADARPAKGEGPTSVAVGFGAIWVGTGDGRLLRLDPRTGQVRERLRSDGHVASVVIASGALWLSDSGLGVVRLEPYSGPPSRFVVAAHGPLAVGAGALWAADYGRERVYRIDRRSARVVAAVRVPGRLVSVFAGPAGPFVVYSPTAGPLSGPRGPRLLQRLDPVSARLVARPVPFDCDLTAVVARKVLFTVDFCTWRVARRDPRTLAVLADARAPRTATFAVHAFGSLWISGGSRLVRFDPTTLRVEARLWIRAGVAVRGERRLWLAGDTTLRALDPRTNRIVRTYRVSG
jgi:streptogramin lyase